jgi:hypothetical protein
VCTGGGRYVQYSMYSCKEEEYVEEQEYSPMKVWEAAEIEAPSRRGVNCKNEETESSRNKGP